MSHTKQSLVIFKDSNSLGLDKVPDGRMIYINSLGLFFIKDNSISIADIISISDGASALTPNLFNDNSNFSTYTGNGNFNDLSGIHNGTAYGTVTYAENEVKIGATSYIDIGTVTWLGSTIETFSFSVWKKLSGAFCLSTERSDGQKVGDVKILLGDSYAQMIVDYSVDAPYAVLYTITFPPLTKTYNHFYFEKNGNINIKLYINGVLIETKITGYIYSGSLLQYSNFEIGRHRNAQWATDYYPVTFDQLRLMNRALSVSEIAQLYAEKIKFNNATIDTAIINKNILEMGKRNKCPSLNSLFYGGSVSANTITILTASATLAQAENITAGTSRSGVAGANSGVNALFYGGSGVSNLATLLSNVGNLVQMESNVGTARENLGGANVGTNCIFFGGDITSTNLPNKTTIITPQATLAQTEGAVSTGRYLVSGANINTTNALFYGGWTYASGILALTTVLSSTGSAVQADKYVGTNRAGYGVASLYNGGAIAYAGWHYTYGNFNKVSLLTASADLVQVETNIGTIRNGLAGTISGNNTLFYGSGIATIISSTATQVGSEITIGISRTNLGGSSVQI